MVLELNPSKYSLSRVIRALQYLFFYVFSGFWTNFGSKQSTIVSGDFGPKALSNFITNYHQLVPFVPPNRSENVLEGLRRSKNG